MKRAKPKADPELDWLLKIDKAADKLMVEALNLRAEVFNCMADYERYQAAKAAQPLRKDAA